MEENKTVVVEKKGFIESKIDAAKDAIKSKEETEEAKPKKDKKALIGLGAAGLGIVTAILIGKKVTSNGDHETTPSPSYEEMNQE